MLDGLNGKLWKIYKKGLVTTWKVGGGTVLELVRNTVTPSRTGFHIVATSRATQEVLIYCGRSLGRGPERFFTDILRAGNVSHQLQRVK